MIKQSTIFTYRLLAQMQEFFLRTIPSQKRKVDRDRMIDVVEHVQVVVVRCVLLGSRKSVNARHQHMPCHAVTARHNLMCRSRFGHLNLFEGHLHTNDATTYSIPRRTDTGLCA